MPMSPIIDAHMIEDPHNLELKLRVNDKVTQNDNTGNMHFKIPDIIEFISSYMTLVPGDIIITGTPDGINKLYRQILILGVGPIKPGDEVHAQIF